MILNQYAEISWNNSTNNIYFCNILYHHVGSKFRSPSRSTMGFLFSICTQIMAACIFRMQRPGVILLFQKIKIKNCTQMKFEPRVDWFVICTKPIDYQLVKFARPSTMENILTLRVTCIWYYTSTWLWSLVNVIVEVLVQAVVSSKVDIKLNHEMIGTLYMILDQYMWYHVWGHWISRK